MRIIIYKYVINEIWPTFMACLAVCVFIVIATKMLPITDLIVSKGIPMSQVGMMIAYLLPDIILFALPAASLISIVLAFLRLSVDSEIIAMKSSGISLYQLMPPVALLGGLGMVVALFISLVFLPWGNRSFKTMLFEIGRSKVDMGIKERVFCEPFFGVVFYVNHYSEQTKEMEDVFVSDRRDPVYNSTIIAEKGKVFVSPNGEMVTMALRDGNIFVVDNDLRSGRTVKFKSYDLNIDLSWVTDLAGMREKSPKELDQAGLLKALEKTPKTSEKYNTLMIELLEKYSIPVAVFLMGFIGASLGSQLRVRGRSMGIGVSLVIFVVYYLFLAGAERICESGLVPPVIGVWIPDLFLLIAGIYMMRRVAAEKPLWFFSK